MTNRRGSGEGAIYQRADGKWVAALDLGLSDSGKRQRRVYYGRTHTEARTKLLTAQREHAERRLALSSPTVQNWLDYWLTEVAEIRPKTRGTYRSYIDKHIVPVVGTKRLDRLTQTDVRRIYARMRADGKSDATVRQVHAILARALTIAQREKKVAENICDKTHMQAPKVPKGTERQPLSLDDARKVLATANGDEFEARWYAALYLGLRQGEALGLHWTDVNLQEGTIFIRQALQRVTGKGLVLVQPKSEASIRIIPLPTVVASRLTVHWARHVAAGGTQSGFVWTKDGKPIDASRDTKRWKQLLVRAGVPHVALHAARNTAGSLLMEARVPDTVAKEILGHSSVVVTRRHYQRGDLTQHRAAMADMQALIEGP